MLWTKLLKSSLLTGLDTVLLRMEERRDGLALDQLSSLIILVVSYSCTLILDLRLDKVDTILKNLP